MTKSHATSYEEEKVQMLKVFIKYPHTYLDIILGTFC